MPSNDSAGAAASSPPRSPVTPGKKSSDGPTTPSKDNQQFPDVEGIPIGAKFKGPGPLYSLPPCIGPQAKYFGKRSPAFSLGVKLQEANRSIGPGPAAFSPRITLKGPSFSLQGGFKKTRKDGRAVIYGQNPHREDPSEIDLDNPGPAKYLLSPNHHVSHRSPAFTITSRQPEEKSSQTPGPAAYNLPTAIGSKQIVVKSSPSPTIAAMRNESLESKSPGPAAYQPVSPKKVQPSSPAYSLGRRWEKDVSLLYAKTIPGPGAYNPGTKVKKEAPAYSFRQKHSEYEYFVPDGTEQQGPLII